MENETLLNNTYRILQPIGAGGIGEIYLGYHENLQKYVVIKKVKNHCTGLTNNRTEVDILKGLHHTYLPQVYDFLETDQGIFTVMEYIAGYDLKYYIDNGYQFTEEQLVIWLKQLCQVLDYLHTRKQKIIHCDIKPGNIMITEEGNICLIDFNISLDGENNKELVGLSSFYASPEQIRKAEHKMRYGSGDAVKMDERTDIYSLGAVFYYLMSGYRAETRSGYVRPLKDMEIPFNEALVNIVDKAMEMDASRRFRSAARMLEAIEHQERWTTQYRKMWKKRALLGFLTASTVIILGATAFVVYRNTKVDEFFEAQEVFKDKVNDWVDEQNGNIITDEEALSIAEEIVGEGIDLLNERSFEKLLIKYPQQKADILYGIAQAYISLEEYEEAENYLDEIIESGTDRPEVYRDMSIVLAKEEEISEAEDMLKEAMKSGLDEESGYLLMAEIALAKEDYEIAWEYAVQAAESEDISVAQQAAYYITEAGDRQGQAEESVAVLAELAGRSNGMMQDVWLRQQGELCLKLYESGNNSYLKNAAACFEKIYERGYAGRTDSYNLAAVYTHQKKYEKAKRLLLNMKKSYPQEYKVPMYLAFVSYRAEGEKSGKERDYSSVEKYYKEALKLSKEQGIDAETDFNMKQLENIIAQLEEQGWLK